MPLWDRVLRSLFVALAVGLGWGIRGKYGHLLGAMVPGASLGMALAYVSGQQSAMKWMPILGGFGAFFISLGGSMSYGLLHGYAQADTLVNYSYGFFTLLLEGGAWGGFCGAALGLLLERERVTVGEVVSAVATVYAGGWLFFYLVVTLIGFHINPGRNDTSINFVGQILALFAWMIYNKRWIGLRGLSLGCMGFGLGMALGRLAGNAVRLAPFDIEHWTVMETTCGIVGGWVFAFGLLGRKLDHLPEERGWPGASLLGIVYVMAFIPLLHNITRIVSAGRTERWIGILNARGVNDPEVVQESIDLMLSGINAVCVAGFIAAAIWILLWKQDRARWSWYPVMMFNLLMLTFLCLDVFYVNELRSPRDNSINIHTVFWGMLASMALFALAFETIWPRREVVDADEATERIPGIRWGLATALTFAAIIGCASFTNGDITMKTAEMRWPLWSWRDGHPPNYEQQIAPGRPTENGEGSRR